MQLLLVATESWNQCFQRKKCWWQYPKRCITKKKQRDALSLHPHPSVLEETISAACDSLRLLRAAIMNPAQANVFHRTCKHQFSFAGHWLKENTLVKFKPSPFSLLLAQQHKHFLWNPSNLHFNGPQPWSTLELKHPALAASKIQNGCGPSCFFWPSIGSYRGCQETKASTSHQCLVCVESLSPSSN